MKGSKWRGASRPFHLPGTAPPHFPSTVALQVPGVSGFSAEALGENAGRCRQLSLSGMLDTDKGREALPAASGPSAGRATHPPQLLPGQATGLGVPSGPAGGKRPGGSFPLCPAIVPRTKLGAGLVLPRGPKWGGGLAALLPREKVLCKQVMRLSETESHLSSNAQPAFGAALRDHVLSGGDTPSSWSL